MEFHAIDIALHLINIVVLFVLLRMWVFTPVQSFMAKRQERIDTQLKEASDQQMQAHDLTLELQDKLSAIDDTCAKLVSESRQKGNEAAQKIIDKAEAQALDILRENRQVAEIQRNQVVDAAKVGIADLAVDMAARVLKFDQAVLSQVVEPKAKQGNLEGTLKTATHCNGDTLSAITTMLENLLGTNLQLAVEEDDSLLGGFIAYIDGQVYDFSYTAQLSAMKQALA